jgi:hypothetical protein
MVVCGLVVLARGINIFRLIAVLLFSNNIHAQYSVAAGPQYKKSSFHEWLWGKHYRKEWIEPVKVPGFLLDTAAGGLKPYQEGGGRQSKSLRLQNPAKKEYVVRSIDKSFGNALSPIYRNTFIETIINDQVSIGHPYAAVTIAPLAHAAGIYYTIPRIVFIPQQPALDSFNEEYGNRLYLFEQRPDENWEEAPNFGNSEKIVGTDKMLENIYEDNDRRVDQLLFVRSREDQWRWASFEEKGKKIYRPIPRDRDQAYIKFDGVLLRVLLSAANLGHLQTFDHTITDVRINNFPSRYLDRQMANEPSLQQWTSIAEDIQRSLTDAVIENAIHELPPEVFPISGDDIISKLKSRRNDLVKYAQYYYLFLAKKVDIVGTHTKELFSISRLNNDETRVTLTKISEKGKAEDEPFYDRVFKKSETEEIRVYGLADNDIYYIDGNANKGIRVRIIGGKDKDSIVDRSVGAGRNVFIYDDHDNSIVKSKSTRLRLSNDDSVHNFQYRSFHYDKKGISPKLFYSYADRIYIGVGYGITRYDWRKEPFESDNGLELRYSLTQHAFSVVYKGTFTRVIGKWNADLYGNYDWMRWTNYYGMGNETPVLKGNRDFHRMRSREALVSVGMSRKLGEHLKIEFAPRYQVIRVLPDQERFVAQVLPSSKEVDKQHRYGGMMAGLSITRLNDLIVPTKGIYFTAAAEHLKNLKISKQFTRYTSAFHFYL